MTRETSLDQRFAEAMGQLLGPHFPTDIGLAVSGGGDSMAMLYLAHNWTRVWGVRLWVCTVDHGLRPEAAGEAAMVARECAALGWPHATLKWTWDGQGNVMDRARQARLELIDRWCGEVRHVLMAHTEDDVAETFVMRLARGSGADGLAAMDATRRFSGIFPCPSLTSAEVSGVLPPSNPPGEGRALGPEGFTVVRPLLEVRRADLRHYLRVLQGPWVDDPTNDDPAYERSRVRLAGEALASLGLDAGTLAGAARRMARVSEALAVRALQVWREHGREEMATGDLRIARDGFAEVERETQMRVLSAALMHVSEAEYPPREAPLESLLDMLLAGGPGTLHGCEAVVEKEHIRIFREYAEVAECRAGVEEGALWDGRWMIRWQEAYDGCEVRALGHEGWVQAGEKPEGTPPYKAARSLPAVWDGMRLIACDGIGFGPQGAFSLAPGGRYWTMVDRLAQKLKANRR